MNPDCEELIERWPLIKKFDLEPGANVLVVGAYRGLAMEALANLYPECSLIVGFEPQGWAAEDASERLKPYPICLVFDEALGTEAGEFPMGEWHTDACSFVNTGPGSRERGRGWMVDADQFLRGPLYQTIDLMIVNIEGYEYKLLPYMHEHGLLDRVKRLAVQWHWGLGPDPMDSHDMDDHIDRLLVEDNYKLVHDDRPAWTYMEKNR